MAIESTTYHYQTLLTPEKREAIVNERKTLLECLDKIDKIFKVSLEEETFPLTDEGFKNYIVEFFQCAQDFNKQIKALTEELPKGSKERKFLFKLAKNYVEHIHKQQAIFKVPSSDPYLFSLQKKYFAAEQSLKNLKQSQTQVKVCSANRCLTRMNKA